MKKIKKLEKAIETDSKNIKLIHQLIALYDYDNEHQKAIKLIRQTLLLLDYKEKPQLVCSMYLNMAGILLKIDELEESLSNVNKAIGFNKKNAGCYHLKGVILQILGERYDAMKAFELAVYYNPNEAFYRGYMYLSQSLNKMRKAKEIGENGEADKNLSRAYFLEAKGLLDKCYILNPLNDAVNYNMGEIWLFLGDPKMALSKFNEVKRTEIFTDIDYYKSKAKQQIEKKQNVIDFNKFRMIQLKGNCPGKSSFYTAP